MAHKQDTFWEEHEHVYSDDGDASDELGMVAEEVRDWKTWGPTLLLGVPLFALYLHELYQSGLESSGFSVTLMLLFPILFGLDSFVRAALRRYRLVENDAWAEDGPPAPRRPHTLLRHIIQTPALFARLETPKAGDSPIRFHPDDRGRGIWITMFFYGLAACFALLRLLLYGSPRAALYLALIAVVPYRAWRLRARVKTGTRALGTGREDKVAKAYPRRFEDVQRAELRWDTFLGQSYLLLDFKDKQLRYYAPTDDPLYVLRVAKHRMPQVKLSVQPI